MVLFTNFSNENLSGHTLLKSSKARGIKARILEQYSDLEDCYDEIFPKRSMAKVKGPNHLEIICRYNEPLFFIMRDDENIYPTLRFIHLYANSMTSIQCDKGAIRHLLSGSNCMCPGLTSSGGDLGNRFLERGTAVAVKGQGKETIFGIGRLLLSTSEIQSKNKGHAIEMLHVLGDGLWNTDTVA